MVGKWGRTSWRALAVAVVAAPSAAILAALFVLTARGDRAGADYAIFRAAGDAVAHGHSPYVGSPTLALLSQDTHFVYPTPFAFPFVPFALIPQHLGAVLFLLLSAAALVGALRVLDVRDWRLYAVVFAWPPVFSALGIGTLGPLLLLAVAAGWKLRHSWLAGVLFALAAAAKLFLWPVLVWLLLTRRWRASAAAGATLVVIAVMWLATDLEGFLHYPRIVQLLELGHPNTYSPRSVLLALGVPDAGLVPVLFAVLGIALMWMNREDERAAFAAAVLTALLTTPILWMHYLVLLAVPLALARRRLSWHWCIPLALWVNPTSEHPQHVWRMLFALAVTAASCAAVASFADRIIPRLLTPGIDPS